MKKHRILIVHVTALLLFAFYFYAAGYAGLHTYRSVIRRISRYQYWEALRHPDGLHEQLSEYILYSLPGRESVIRNIYSNIMLAQGKRATRNFYAIRDDSGYLYHGNFYQFPNFDVKTYARRVRTFAGLPYLNDKKFLVIGGADKYISAYSTLYSGYPVNIMMNNDMDSLLLNLFQFNVDNMDFRHIFMNSILDYNEIYYKTDRGWTAKAALEAAGAIAAKLETSSDIKIDPAGFFRNEANYSMYRCNSPFRGIYGRAAGIPFGGTDVFSLPLPEFDTFFSVYQSLNSAEPEKEGSFYDVIIDYNYLYSNPETVELSKVYMIDSGSRAFSFRRFINHENPDGYKIIFIGGGDFVPAVAYLSLMCRELVFISANSSIYRNQLDLILNREDFDCLLFGIELDGINEILFSYLPQG